jgi:hypothetical protein
MDLDDVEAIDFRALGGADNIVVGDLSGTDVTQIASTCAGPTAAATARPTRSRSTAPRAPTSSGLRRRRRGHRLRLRARVNIFSPEQANDRLTLNGLGGDDVIDATSLEADGIQLTMNGGLGADVSSAARGTTWSTAGTATTWPSWAPATTLRLEPGDDNDTSRARPASTPCSSTAPTSPRPSPSSPTAGASSSSATWPA